MNEDLNRPQDFLYPPAAGGFGADLNDSGAAEAHYADVLDSLCGSVDDSQAVELYDGTLGVTKELVGARQRAVGQVQWNANLATIYTNPGNVNGQRWGSGTMISNDLFLTVGHLFDKHLPAPPTGVHWRVPLQNGTLSPIEPAEIATNMHVNFDYQLDASGLARTEQSFAIVDLVEYRLAGIDYAIVRLNGDPGAAFGVSTIAALDASIDDRICIVGHPAGHRKRIEAGVLKVFDGDYLRYDDIDTLGGNSGSGIIREPGQLIVGVHTNGGCDDPAFLTNKGVRVSSIRASSPTISSRLSGYVGVMQCGDTDVWTFDPYDGFTDLGLGMMANTSPCIVALNLPPLYAVVFQANTGNLWTVDRDLGPVDRGLGMMSDTSPSATFCYKRYYAVAFQANTGNLWTMDPDLGAVDRGLAMMPGTSPSIVLLADPQQYYAVAFQGGNGNLWTMDPDLGAVDRGLGMHAGSSPSITHLYKNWYAVAFQANTSNLWTMDPDLGAVDRGLGMVANTSPSIVGLDSARRYYAVAFQANTSNLWTIDPDLGAVDRGLGMMANTSPSIAHEYSNYYSVAFQANTGKLWTVDPLLGAVDRGLSLRAGTSPNIDRRL